MRHWHGIGLAVMVVAASGAVASQKAESIRSGPAIGEFVSPFDVYDVTGPSKGTELCYR